MKDKPESAPLSHDAVDKYEALVEALAKGELRFYQLPKDLSADEAAAVRRRALERRSRAGLAFIGRYALDAERASTRHCENFIGAAQVPMGVVGPLAVHGDYTEGDFLVPLATTEGALLASINRGCAAIRAAGGARAFVEDVGMTRAPVFETTGVQQTRELIRWVETHEEEIRQAAEGTSRYLKLLDIRPFSFGSTVFLRFRFESGDAMGMNMATIACDRAVTQLIEPATGVRCIALSGNYCVDKKPAAINFQEGRGKRIHAEVVLEAPVLARYLKTNARSLATVQYRKNLLGSIAAGSQGFNAHIANVAAAFFIATGQDLAHVVGASMGITSIEPRGEDAVYASIFLPDLPLGAVGGGTTLETQREALALLGIRPDPERPGAAALRLAEIFGATVLAGELSLMAAFTSQDLASAHERLGRGPEATAARAAGTPAASAAGSAPRALGETVTCSAPGKVILMGEHAVVYGRPALVAAADLRLTASLTPLAGDGPNRLELPQLDHREEVSWEAITAYGQAARERWQAYRDRPGAEAFARLRGDDPAHVVKVALAEAATHLDLAAPPRFDLRVVSELPVGSGFGSSAAAALAVLGAFLDLADPGADEAARQELLERLALEAERRQHGMPSGVDAATVLHGGVVWARRNVEGGVQLEPLPGDAPLLSRLQVFNSGAPAEPTGAVVAAVREQVDADPLRYEDLFDRMERATWGLRQELGRRQENPLRVIALIRQYQGCLEQLGVVPPAVKARVRQVEERGGAAKISGAGALTGDGAGSLLVYHPADDEAEGWSFLADLPRYPLTLGTEGLRREGR